MELFKRFSETIFYKKNSDLEKQLEVLKKLNKEFPDNDKIMQKMKLCELGIKGEKEIEYELKNSNIGMYVLHDITMKYGDLKAQIDYIIITPAGVYFIECKNLIGNITVNDRGEFIREYSYNGKKVREGIYSPIRQSERHVEIFKKIWSSRNIGIINKLKLNNIDNWCKYLVVTTNSKNILNVKYAPKEIKSKIIRSDNLVKFLQDEINRADKSLLSKEKEMRENAQSILKNYHFDEKRDFEAEFREKLIDSINVKDDEILRNKLIEFRKKKSMEKNIPAYYIFNNNELEKILNTNPKNIMELKNILSDIKLKLYGKEIIDILKSVY